MDSEYDVVAKLGRHTVAPAFGREKPDQAVGGDIAFDRGRIMSITRDRDGVCIDVAGEDLKLDVALLRANLFEEKNS